jgi:hypothetical protein
MADAIETSPSVKTKPIALFIKNTNKRNTIIINADPGPSTPVNPPAKAPVIVLLAAPIKNPVTD